jgi:hypothetical protein
MKESRYNPGVVKVRFRYEEIVSPRITRIVRNRAQLMDFAISTGVAKPCAVSKSVPHGAKEAWYHEY